MAKSDKNNDLFRELSSVIDKLQREEMNFYISNFVKDRVPLPAFDMKQEARARSMEELEKIAISKTSEVAAVIINYLSGSYVNKKKAALLLVSLSPSASALILRNLSGDFIKKASQTIKKLPYISQEERKLIIKDFFVKLERYEKENFIKEKEKDFLIHQEELFNYNSEKYKISFFPEKKEAVINFCNQWCLNLKFYFKENNIIMKIISPRIKILTVKKELRKDCFSIFSCGAYNIAFVIYRKELYLQVFNTINTKVVNEISLISSVKNTKIYIKKEEDNKKVALSDILEKDERFKNNKRYILIQAGTNIYPLINPSRKIRAIKKYIELGLDKILPEIIVKKNTALDPDTYIIKIMNFEAGKGKIMPSLLLAIEPEEINDKIIKGIECFEPIYGMPAVWIESQKQVEAEKAGYQVFDPFSIILSHIREVIQWNGHKFIGPDEVKFLLKDATKSDPQLVNETLNLLSVEEIEEILKILLKDDTSIKNFSAILRILKDHAHITRNPVLLSSYISDILTEQSEESYFPANEEKEQVKSDDDNIKKDKITFTEKCFRPFVKAYNIMVRFIKFLIPFLDKNNSGFRAKKIEERRKRRRERIREKASFSHIRSVFPGISHEEASSSLKECNGSTAEAIINIKRKREDEENSKINILLNSVAGITEEEAKKAIRENKGDVKEALLYLKVNKKRLRRREKGPLCIKDLKKEHVFESALSILKEEQKKVDYICNRTGVSPEEARKALKENNRDAVEAVLSIRRRMDKMD